MIVLDTGALLAYARGVPGIGLVLADLSDVNEDAAIADTCLIEAYSLLDVDRFELLSVLRGLPAIGVYGPDGDDLPFIGGMARRSGGNLAAGHAAFLALRLGASVYTSRPDELWAVLGDTWPCYELPDR